MNNNNCNKIHWRDIHGYIIDLISRMYQKIKYDIIIYDDYNDNNDKPAKLLAQFVIDVINLIFKEHNINKKYEIVGKKVTNDGYKYYTFQTKLNDL